MEQFTKLPQVRISQLEQLISCKPKKQGYSCRTLTQPADAAVVSGLKPFYTHSRKQNRVCCGHLKCDCRGSFRNHYEGLKHQYLTRRRNDENQPMVRYKTEAFEKEEEVERKPSTSARRHNQHYRQNTEGNATLSNRQEIDQKLHDRIRKQLSRKMFLKFGRLAQKQEVKVLIQQYAKKNYRTKQPLTNIHQLFQKIQKALNPNPNHNPKTPHPKIPKKTTTNLRPTIQKSLKKLPLNSTHKFNNNKYKYKSKSKSKSKKKSNKNKKNQENCGQGVEKLDQDTMDLINLLLYRDKRELIQVFLEEMVNAGLQKFSINITNIQKILQQYQNQPHIIQTLTTILTQLKSRLQSVQSLQPTTVHPHTKLTSIKIALLQKILRSKTHSQSTEHAEAEDLVRRVTRKTLKVKKSQKTVRIVNTQLSSPSLNPSPSPSPSPFPFSSPQQPQPQKFPKPKSTVSLVQNLQEDENSENSRSSIKLMTNKSNRRSKKSSMKIMVGGSGRGKGDGHVQEEEDGVDEGSQGSQGSFWDRSSQDITQQQLQQYFRLKGKKKTIRRSSGQATRLLPTPSPPPQKNPPQSTFKNQKQTLLREIRQAQTKPQLALKQLLQQHKETTIKGIHNLRLYHLQNLIILQSDSVLTKKKKIRYIKQKINQVEVLNKKKIVDQLLAYIHLYQLECQLLMRRCGDEDRRLGAAIGGGIGGGLGVDLDDGIIRRSMFEEELKFIQLNSNYYYGEQEDQEFNFKFVNRFQQIKLKNKVTFLNNRQQPKNPTPQKSPQKTLLQIQLPQSAQLQQILQLAPNTAKTSLKTSCKTLRTDQTVIPSVGSAVGSAVGTTAGTTIGGQQKNSKKSIMKFSNTRWGSEGDSQGSFCWRKLDRFLVTENTVCL